MSPPRPITSIRDVCINETIHIKEGKKDGVKEREGERILHLCLVDTREQMHVRPLWREIKKNKQLQGVLAPIPTGSR